MAPRESETVTPAVRRAVDSDGDAIARLLAQLGYETKAEAIPAGLAALEAEGAAAFVAVGEDTPVIGLATATRHTTLHAGGQVAYITALVTDRDARRQGVGRALVAAIEAWAIAHGCSRVSVTSAEHRADAHVFYPSCGFPYTGRRFTKNLVRPS